MVTWRSLTGSKSSTLTPSGKASAENSGGRVKSRAATEAVIWQARGGLPMETRRPSEGLPGTSGGAGALEDGRAHVYRHVTRFAQLDALEAGAGEDLELAGGSETVVDQVAGEDPDAVAAHLGDRAVGVAVVHEPLGLFCPDHAQD